MLRAAETIQRTDTGRQRRGNEDSSYARAPVFVIADGMGGAQAGEVASQIAVEAFAQGLPERGTAEERLSVVVQRANREIYERAQAERDRAGMGTTLTAAYLDGDHVAIAHVGDSRAYLLRDGELTRLTEDHSLVEELLRGGKLTEQEALEHPQRSIITRALGPEPIVEVDTWSYPLNVARHAPVTNQSHKTVHENIVVDSAARAVYWLSGDSKSHPECTKANHCFKFWPVVKVPSARRLSKAPGVPGKLGTWKRDGFIQVTLGGHPLYTFAGDKMKRHATGQGIKAFGGKWSVAKARSTARG